MPLNQYSFFHLYVQFSNPVRGRKQIPMTVSEYIIRTCFFSKNPAEVSKGVVSTETLPGAGAACGSSDDIPDCPCPQSKSHRIFAAARVDHFLSIRVPDILDPTA